MYNLSNVNITIRKLDGINISNDLDNSTLQYLIDKYFYVTGYTYNENDNIVKVTYDIYNDKYYELLSDDNLTVNIKKFFVLYILASMCGCINIYMLTNNEFLDNIIFVFDIKRKDEIMFCKLYCDSHYDDYLLYLDINKGHHIDYLYFDNITVNSNYLNSLSLVHKKMRGYWESLRQLTRARMVLVENETLTEGDYDLISNYYSLNSRHYESKRFIYKLKFDNNITLILWLKNVYVMFGLRNQIYDFLNTIKNIFNPNALTIKICSAVLDESTQNVSDNCTGYGKYAEDFLFGYHTGLLNYHCDGLRYGPAKYVDTYVNYYVNVLNNEIKDYVIETYFDNNDYVSSSNYNNRINNCLNNIKQCYNFYSQQIEYYDLKSEFVDSNVGDVNNSYYIDILGYDSTTLNPIVLYISNKVYLDETHYVYFYKVLSGGIEPINNNYLLKPYDKTVSESSDLIASLIINMYDPPNKMDVLQTYMDVMGISCNKPLVKSPDNSIQLLINNLTVGGTPSHNYYILKHEMYQYAVPSDNLIPFQAMVDLFNTTPLTCTELENLLKKYFVYDENEIVLDMIYDTIFLKYRKYMEPKYYYFVTTGAPYDLFYSNLIMIQSTYDEIKNKQLLQYIVDTTTYNDLNVLKISDVGSLEPVKIINGELIYDMIAQIPSIQEVDMDCTGEADFGLYTLSENKIISNFFEEKIIDFDKPDYDTDDICLIYCKYRDILTKSPNKFVITNKVLGSDLLLWFGFKSSKSDLTFNNLFLSAILSLDGMFILYDMYNDKLYTLKFNDINLEFQPNTTRPLKFNTEIMNNLKMYKLDRDDFDLTFNILGEYKFFQTINNIKFAYKPYDTVSDTIFYPFGNDFVLVGS